MKTAAQTLEEILNLAATHCKVPRAELSPDDDFFKKLGINSLQALDLLTRLEQHFGVELPDYELQGVSDFSALAESALTRKRDLAAERIWGEIEKLLLRRLQRCAASRRSTTPLEACRGWMRRARRHQGSPHRQMHGQHSD